MTTSFLRRPGTLAQTIVGYVLIVIGMLLALAGLAATGRAGLLAGAFAPVGAYVVWGGRASGLRVTPAAVLLVSGLLRRRVCATPEVATLRLVRTGTAWDDHQEVQFLDGGGTVLGRVVNRFNSGRGFTASWKPAELEALAATAGWRWQLDLSDAHVTHPPPRYSDDDA